ncbi:MAG TPA: hypothetical protein VIP82_09865, partial [Microbacterium sp.]
MPHPRVTRESRPRGARAARVLAGLAVAAALTLLAGCGNGGIPLPTALPTTLPTGVPTTLPTDLPTRTPGLPTRSPEP